MPAADIAHVLGGEGVAMATWCGARHTRIATPVCRYVMASAACWSNVMPAAMPATCWPSCVAAASSISYRSPARRAEGTKDDHERRQRDKAKRLWSQRQPIVGTVAERYLCGRGYDAPTPPTIAFLPARDAYPPAMIVAFGMPEEPEPGILAAPRSVNAVHLTRLKPDGSDRERGPEAKIMIGRSVGKSDRCGAGERPARPGYHGRN